MARTTWVAPVAVVVLCGSLLFFGCRADVTQAQSTNIIRDYAGSDIPQERWNWVNEQWTGDDRPFQKIEANVDAAPNSEQEAGRLAAQYRLKAIAAPKDARATFAWAYAVMKYIHIAPLSTETRIMSYRVREALDQPPSPHSYTYDRLRFLLSYDKSHIMGLGERLLKQNPADHAVKLQLVYIYTGSFGSSLLVSEGAASKFKTRALQLAEELIKSDSTNTDYRAALGNIYAFYFTRHYQDKQYQREYAVKALAAYQDYLQLAKPDDDRYRDVMTLNNSMKRFLETGDLR